MHARRRSDTSGSGGLTRGRWSQMTWPGASSLRVKVIAAILLAILPLAASIILFGFYVRADEQVDDELTAHRKLRITAASVLDLAIDAETGVRGFLVTHRENFLEPYNRARALLPGELSNLVRYAHEHERPLIPEVEALVAREMALLEDLAEAPPDRATRADLERGKVVMDRLRAATAHLIDTTEEEMDALVAARAASRSTAYKTLITAAGIGALSSLGAGFVLVGSVVTRVRRSTENARLLAEGGELVPADEGNDELAELSQRLHQTALLLRSRESALRQAREEADRANTAKSEFLSRMSHELRTPLNAVIGFAQLLRQSVNDEQREDVLEILRAGKHLLALIDEVLDLSRIETGMISMSVEPVSLADVVAESIALVKGAAERHSIDIRVAEFDPELHVLADRQRLKQVLVNLLSNSVKYNRSAGISGIQVTRRDGWVRVSVSDQGNGIPEPLQRNLFTPFSRLGAEQTSIEGTGLGLALSKHLAEAMRGELGLESEVGTGSTFWIDLPYTDQTHEAEVSLGPATEAMQEPVALDGAIQVLQFEDNPSNVRLIQRALRSRSDVVLTTAMTGAEGLQIMKTSSPDLVLLDVNLPDISGMDVLVRLRADPTTRGVPVVVLSADATETQIEHMLALGADRYLTKPVEMKELNSVLDAAVRRRVEGETSG